MADLSVQFLGTRVPNPFLLASAPPTAFGENIMRAFDQGWGGAVLKTLKPDGMLVEDARPRFAAIKDDKGKVWGFENFELITRRELSDWTREIETIKKRYPENLLVASIMGDSEASWQEMTRRVQDAGADMIECNFSCPHGMPEQGVGMAIGQAPKITRQITAWVKEAATVPVIIKLTPNVTDPRIVCQAALDGGADGLTAINTVQCLVGVDVDTFKPQPEVYGYSSYGGYSGKAVKPIGLRVVSQIASHACACDESRFSRAISGCGGVSDWKDAVEYMLVGATTVQVCTEVMLHGYGVITKMVRGFEEYLDAKGFASAMDLVGKTLPFLTSHELLRKGGDRVATVDRESCVGCTLCVTACRDSGYGAIAMNGDKTVEVDASRCDGCGLCAAVCRTGAMAI